MRIGMVTLGLWGGLAHWVCGVDWHNGCVGLSGDIGCVGWNSDIRQVSLNVDTKHVNWWHSTCEGDSYWFERVLWPPLYIAGKLIIHCIPLPLSSPVPDTHSIQCVEMSTNTPVYLQGLLPVTDIPTSVYFLFLLALPLPRVVLPITTSPGRSLGMTVHPQCPHLRYKCQKCLELHAGKRLT